MKIWKGKGNFGWKQHQHLLDTISPSRQNTSYRRVKQIQRNTMRNHPVLSQSNKLRHKTQIFIQPVENNNQYDNIQRKWKLFHQQAEGNL